MTLSHSKKNRSDASPLHLLVVDDDAGQRSLLKSFLEGQGHTVTTADSGRAALDRIQDTPDIAMMISDVRMPEMDGLETLRRARELRKDLPVLMVTAYADIRDAVHAMRDGAVNYLEKPIDLDELLDAVGRATGATVSRDRSLTIEDLRLPPEIIAKSPATYQVFREIALVAPSESRILITGESGAGKEVIADMVHTWSPRKEGPLVKVNCAAIPENLLESELFGHRKGSFTGASEHRIGRFEEANGGTIFLDEIGEMPPSLQAKLLRVTQDGVFQRVGSNTPVHSDARILAATNQNLDKLVQTGHFREDLFYRLNVIEIYMPPLRERRADILPMATRFAAEFSPGNPRFSAALTACLELYDWPGNVRELRNAMERATLMARGELILPEHLPPRIRAKAIDTYADETGTNSVKRMDEIERVVILQTLREKDFNRTETARALGISRRALIYKLQRFADQGHAIESEETKKGPSGA